MIRHILCGKKFRVIIYDRILYDGLAFLGTEDYPDSRVISFRLFQVIKHTAIHVHLSDILMV